MSRRILVVISTLLATLVLGASLAHLLELPRKISLSAEEYLTVQQIYQGWSMLGILIGITLITVVLLALATRRDPRVRGLVLAALAALALAQVIFWTLTYPVNVATENWTVMPANFEAQRARWEWSHAAGAVLNLFAVGCLIGAAIRIGAATWSLGRPRRRALAPPAAPASVAPISAPG